MSNAPDIAMILRLPAADWRKVCEALDIVATNCAADEHNQDALDCAAVLTRVGGRIEAGLQPDDDPLAERFDDESLRQQAAEQYEEEGQVEIDPDAIVSRGDDPGAYVQAWVWVSYRDIDPDFEDED